MTVLAPSLPPPAIPQNSARARSVVPSAAAVVRSSLLLPSPKTCGRNRFNVQKLHARESAKTAPILARSLDSIGLNNESGDDSTKGSATKMREREREREKGAK